MSFFRKSKETIKSVTVRIARELGFLDTEEVQKAEQLVDECTDQYPTLELMVDHELLTESQADRVRAQRMDSDPKEAMKENVKAARRAYRQVHDTGSLHIAEVAQAQRG